MFIKMLFIRFLTTFSGIKATIEYHKILNIRPGLIGARKHFSEGLYSGGLYSGGLIFGRHFVLVSKYQDLKNHCFI